MSRASIPVVPIPGHDLTVEQLQNDTVPTGYRRVRPGEKIPSNALFWSMTGCWQASPCTDLVLSPLSPGKFIVPEAEVAPH